MKIGTQRTDRVIKRVARSISERKRRSVRVSLTMAGFPCWATHPTMPCPALMRRPLSRRALGPPTMSKTSSWVDGSIRKSDQASHRTSALALSKITRRTDLASRAEARARVVSVRRRNSRTSARVRPCMPEGDLCNGVRLVRECPGVGIASSAGAQAPWHFLYFFPLPQGHGSFRPTFSPVRRTVLSPFPPPASSPRFSLNCGARRGRACTGGACSPCTTWTRNRRSEEHTSELQSLAYLVCRLLLEKKKNKSTLCYLPARHY